MNRMACYTILFCLVFKGFSLFGMTTQLREELGENTFEILENAKYVTLLPLVPENVRKKYSEVKEVHLSQEERERFKRNLLDDHNYDFGRNKICHFLPEVSIKLEDENEQVLHLFVSPSCNQILFALGTGTVLLNYDPAHERLERYFLGLVTETLDKNKESLTWDYQ